MARGNDFLIKAVVIFDTPEMRGVKPPDSDEVNPSQTAIEHGVIMSGQVSVNTAALPSVSTARSVANPSSSAAAPSPAPAASPQAPFLNPQMTIDPALGITVIEFLSSTGAVENSIPSQHQLDAYRQAQAEQTTPAPGTVAKG
ncbi:MAG: hypothetical protein ACP5M5_08550 [Acidibrevibacterium sp.]|uniref:hypothetical protein n=1 Tax=Acidibrevibacterium sp. TaxID=2606776 RepID=UPI003D02DFD6